MREAREIGGNYATVLNISLAKKGLERFYLIRETGNNYQCKTATSKRKKTMEVVHNGEQCRHHSLVCCCGFADILNTTYFTG